MQRRYQGMAICDTAVTSHLGVVLVRRDEKGKTPGPDLLVTRPISLQQQDMASRSISDRRDLAIELV